MPEYTTRVGQILEDLKPIIGAQKRKLAQKHIFLCCDQTKPKCCDRVDGLKSWQHLKRRIDKLPGDKRAGILRTKANCFRICKHGPIAVVYPDGIGYHSCTPEVLDRIVDEHLLEGKPVWEYVIPDCFVKIHK